MELQPTGTASSSQPPLRPRMSRRTPMRQVQQSRGLQDFSLPSSLKWGARRLLRCSNPFGSDPLQSADDQTAHGTTTGNLPSCFSSSPSAEQPLLPRGQGAKHGCTTEGSAAAALDSEVDAALPWNLRKRRSAGNASANNGRSAGKNDSTAEATMQPNKLDTPALRKFSIELSKEEIEKDFLVIIGAKPPRRKKKRPKIVQEQLDSLIPGIWLAERTLDSYKINETRSKKV